MGKQEVEELFSLVRVDGLVEIHGERDPQLAAIFPSPTLVAQASSQLRIEPLSQASGAVVAVTAGQTIE